MAAPRFLFVPGAWHGAWCFDLLLLELQRRAVKCASVDLPALGDDETAPTDATFEAGVERVFGMIGNRRNVKLVGHSFGAFYATEAALRAGGRVREVIYLTSYVPIPGDTFSVMSEMAPLCPEVQAHTTRNEEAQTLELAMQGATDLVYSDVPEGIAAAAATRLRPQPLEPFRQAVISDKEVDFRRRVIVGENDQVLDPGHCVDMAERAGLEAETVPTGHMPFLSMPKLLADTLLGVQ